MDASSGRPDGAKERGGAAARRGASAHRDEERRRAQLRELSKAWGAASTDDESVVSSIVRGTVDGRVAERNRETAPIVVERTRPCGARPPARDAPYRERCERAAARLTFCADDIGAKPSELRRCAWCVEVLPTQFALRERLVADNVARVEADLAARLGADGFAAALDAHWAPHALPHAAASPQLQNLKGRVFLSVVLVFHALCHGARLAEHAALRERFERDVPAALRPGLLEAAAVQGLREQRGGGDGADESSEHSE